MKDQIYISKHLDSINKEIIIEEDNYSIWAYVLDLENNNRIILDGFVCSIGTILKNKTEIKEYIDKNFAPPLSENYANEFSIQNNLIETDFRIEKDKNIVVIYLKDSMFVLLDLVNLKAYSKSLSIAGPYGFPLKDWRNINAR